MSFISIGDIIKAVELAVTIYEKCFSKAHGANIKYLQFGKDIKALADNLQQLERIFSHAFNSNQDRPWQRNRRELSPSLKPLLDITGDFNATLQECNTLLSDRKRFGRSSSNYVDNVLWWASTEKDVNALRERVHFHVTKIFFVIKPFEIHLLIGIRDDLQAVREDVRVIRGILVQDALKYRIETSAALSLPPIPDDISSRLQAALNINPPKSYQDGQHFPLKEGFDALVFHFSQSTVEFNPGLDPSQRVPEETQYLNLVKTGWIIEMIKASVRFTNVNAGSGSLWADYLKELERDVVKEYERFGSSQLIAPPSADIQRLPDSCFSVWLAEAGPPQPPSQSEPGPLEEKILKLDLTVAPGTLRKTLTILRKSDLVLRMVSTDTDENNKDFMWGQSSDVNIHQTKLIPAYAVPEDSVGSPSSTTNMLLCSPGQEPIWQYFKNEDDAKLFQQAITGYRVFHDMSAITWSINGSSNADKSGKGRLQFWQLDPLKPLEPNPHPLQRIPSSMTVPKSPLGSSNRRLSSIFSNTTVGSSRSATSSVGGPRGNATAILRPDPPVIVIYTLYQGKYTFLYIPLHESLRVEPKSCKCRHSGNTCKRVVIESSNSKMDVRRLCAQDGAIGLYTWDLAVLGSPRHPGFRTTEELTKVKYICFDFPKMADRVQFCDEFSAISMLRDTYVEEYKNTIQERRRMANRPPQR